MEKIILTTPPQWGDKVDTGIEGWFVRTILVEGNIWAEIGPAKNFPEARMLVWPGGKKGGAQIISPLEILRSAWAERKAEKEADKKHKAEWVEETTHFNDDTGRWEGW